MPIFRPTLPGFFLSLSLGLLLPAAALSQEPPQPSPISPSVSPGTPARNLKPPDVAEQQDLQTAINSAANDRAALVKNLEAFLKKYPQSSKRPQIYRALVESSLQLRDFSRAVDYSERLLSLNPEDISNTVLAIQLLDRYGDVPGYRRAVFYCSRVLEYIEHTPQAEKSPKFSPEDWESSKKHDRASMLLVRGGLYQKLNDLPDAQKDFEAGYALIPSATAAERLGELAERKKDLNAAILQFARAFALSDGSNGAPSRADLRKKIGNVWRLAHGSEDGLGDYLLHVFDDTSAAASPLRPARNPNGKEPYDFVLRKVTDGGQIRLADAKGKIVVLSFWTTWCGPCRELEPHFERVVAHFGGRNDLLFYALNCDDDESLVLPFLQNEKPKTPALFADGLDRLLGVNSYPTTVILDRAGKIAFRVDGFDPEGFEKSLTDAIERTSQGSGVSSPLAALKP